MDIVNSWLDEYSQNVASHRGETMGKALSQLEQEAKQLPAADRAHLAHSLIASLDIGEDVEAEELWLQEAERRYQDYRRGTLAPKPAAQVFDDAPPS
jgi:hypothetical protein